MAIGKLYPLLMDGCRQTQAVVNGWQSANSNRHEWMAVGKLEPLQMDGCRQPQAIMNEWMAVGNLKPS